MCISSNSVNQAQDLMSVTKIEDFPNSLLPIILSLGQLRVAMKCISFHHNKDSKDIRMVGQADLQTKSFSGNAKQILQIFRSYTGDNQHEKYEHLKYHVTSILLHFTYLHFTYFYLHFTFTMQLRMVEVITLLTSDNDDAPANIVNSHHSIPRYQLLEAYIAVSGNKMTITNKILTNQRRPYK